MTRAVRPSVRRVVDAVRAAVADVPRGGLVLATSGGRDSLVLLHAIAAAGLGDRVAAVAVFDHRTGAAARAGVGAVRAAARAVHLPLVVGRAKASLRGATEAAWRQARWEFLRATATRYGATIATGHTRDDHLETVAFRMWRGTGPYGLAGLDVDGGPVRPLLGVSRADVTAYAAAHDVRYVDDPSNLDRRHARVRWRLDLLPAMAATAPGSLRDLLALAARAAVWRRDVERFLAAHVTVTHGFAGTQFDFPSLAEAAPADLPWLWPALLARAGVRADRRGLARLAAGARPGARVPLAGGADVVVRTPTSWIVRRPGRSLPPVPLAGEVQFGRWAFRSASAAPCDASPWHARLPADIHLEVRAWQPGDRLAGPAGPRRVKRWLADAGIIGPLREGWPVVAAGANVFWIPGVCQAVLPPGTPSVAYDCDRRHD